MRMGSSSAWHVRTAWGQPPPEAALLVRSDLKGQGLGSLLLSSLIARCHERGISRQVAEVLQCNSRMLTELPACGSFLGYPSREVAPSLCGLFVG